jgi:tungstate transport system substrate-binding protein
MAALLFACSRREKNPVVKMATTTSTADSGLLDAIHPLFEKKTGCRVYVIAVGSGKAIKHGENGDVDVVLTHDPHLEEKFVRDGFGVDRHLLMHNDFVIVGPEEDPASIRGGKDAAVALRGIAGKKCKFVSRGDESGTHAKEKKLWAAAGIAPSGEWYIQAGQGMGAVLTMTHEMKGYTLTDRGTYLTMRKKFPLAVLCEGDERLLNRYSIMAVNPKKHPHVNYTGACALIEWYLCAEARDAVSRFKVDGEQLFFPDAPK